MFAVSRREWFHDGSGIQQGLVLTCLIFFNIHMTCLLIIMPNIPQQQLQNT